MNKMKRMSLLGAVLLSTSAYGQGPTWSDEQSEVWAVVERSWEDDAAENGKWPGEYAHEGFVSWGDYFVAPRDLERFTKWERINEQTIDTFWYEISPMAIAVENDTAVVMYSLLSGEEDKDGARELVPYKVVEVLIRDGRTWKFLSTTSFSPNDDD